MNRFSKAEQKKGAELKAEIAKRIQRLMKKRGWKQGDLGKAAGLHRTHINKILVSDDGMSLETLRRIAVALEVSTKSLLPRSL